MEKYLPPSALWPNKEMFPNTRGQDWEKGGKWNKKVNKVKKKKREKLERKYQIKKQRESTYKSTIKSLVSLIFKKAEITRLSLLV